MVPFLCGIVCEPPPRIRYASSDDSGRSPIEQTVRRLYRATFTEAVQRGMPPDDAEDAAMQAVLRYLAKRSLNDPIQPAHTEAGLPGNVPGDPLLTLSTDEIQSRAHTEARNSNRSRMRYHARLVSLSNIDADELDASIYRMGERTDLQTDYQNRNFVAAVLATLQQLPPETAVLVWEHYMERRTMVALGAKYGCSPDAVRKRLRRALSQIRQALFNHEWDEPGPA
jgi:RNA polymerase sigma factor (sigma-70 family)